MKKVIIILVLIVIVFVLYVKCEKIYKKNKNNELMIEQCFDEYGNKLNMASYNEDYGLEITCSKVKDK